MATLCSYCIVSYECQFLYFRMFIWFYIYGIFKMLMTKSKIMGYYNYQHRNILKHIPGFLNHKNFFGTEKNSSFLGEEVGIMYFR